MFVMFSWKYKYHLLIKQNTKKQDVWEKKLSLLAIKYDSYSYWLPISLHYLSQAFKCKKAYPELESQLSGYEPVLLLEKTSSDPITHNGLPQLPVVTVLENLMPSATTGTQIAYIHTNTCTKNKKKIFKKHIYHTVCKVLYQEKSLLHKNPKNLSLLSSFTMLSIFSNNSMRYSSRIFCMLEMGKLNKTQLNKFLRSLN